MARIGFTAMAMVHQLPVLVVRLGVSLSEWRAISRRVSSWSAQPAR
ncbi:MAG: hypothetical protein U0163_01790 [Gemmatimonadaceae bacterium]